MTFFRSSMSLMQKCVNQYRPNLKSTSFVTSFFNYSTENKTYIDDMIKGNKIVVFMKGTPERPLCGFSNAILQVLNFHGVTDFKTHNVLADEQLRQDIKEYSNWPTIPQVYINEEFVGGCDIIIDMHKNGELIEELKKVGIRSRLLDKEQNGT